jgi:hypothetical protein
MWGRLQAADYFYYMSDSGLDNIHKYKNPYASPKEVYEYYTNIITDLEILLIRNELGTKRRDTMRYLTYLF